MQQNVRTGGSFFTEADAWVLFDQWVDRCSAFKLYREVTGEYIQPRHGTPDKAARIDRVLVPHGEIATAWRNGAFGVEGKRSDSKVGPLITQALDYSRCVFSLAGTPVVLRWIFIYPFENPGFDLGSIMVNNRIGYIPTPYKSLKFFCDETKLIEINEDGTAKAKAPVAGNKAGSR